MSGEDPTVGPPERLHPLFLVTGLGGALRGMLGGYAAIGYLAATGRSRTALIGGALLLLFGAISIFVYWLRFEYRIGRSDVRIDSGLFSRTSRSIPFDRIQDVDVTQGVLARLFGLAKVKFETGGSGGAKADEGVLQAIALDRAEELRVLVRSKRGQAADLPDAQSDEATPVFAMDLKRVLLAGLFNFSLALFAGLAGLTQTAGDVIGFDPLNRAFWLSLVSAGDPIADFIMAHRAAAAIAGLVLLVAVGAVTGVFRTVLREYRFRLDRSETGLRRRRGLLTLTDVTLPIRRVQAAIVATGPVRDRFGWRELKLQNLARDEGEGGDHVVAPLATDEEVAGILGQLSWRPIAPDIEWRPVSRAYVWVLAIGLAPLLLIAAVQSAFVPLAGLGMSLALVGAVALRWLAWRRTRYALDRDRLLVRGGWWRRRMLILPLARIQSIDIAESFVSRLFGTATLAFGVAGGSGFSAHAIPALERETARQLRDRLLV